MRCSARAPCIDTRRDIKPLLSLHESSDRWDHAVAFMYETMGAWSTEQDVKLMEFMHDSGDRWDLPVALTCMRKTWNERGAVRFWGTAQVNRRLEAVEKNTGDGDPAFPKMQWPPTEVCPLCRLPSLVSKADITWNEDEIYR